MITKGRVLIVLAVLLIIFGINRIPAASSFFYGESV